MFASDEWESAYCCLECKQEIKRMECHVLGKVLRPLPTCRCQIKRLEEEEERRTRLYRKQRLQRVYSKNIMNNELKHASFQSFQNRAGTELAKQEALRFVETFEDRTHGLMIYGPVGNGKSHLCAAIHHEIDRQGLVSLFLDISQLFNIAKSTMNRNSNTSLTDIITAAVDADLLTLDELGIGQLTEYEFNDILFPIINGRQGKKTNYTTNLDLDRLERWFRYDKYKNELDTDGRLFDRIIGSCDIVENTAKSMRKEKALSRLRSS